LSIRQSESIRETKASLRQRLRERLNDLPPVERATGSANLCGLLREQSVWKLARCVLFYAALSDEVDIWPLLEVAIAEDKIVALPRYRSEQECYRAARLQNLGRDTKIGQFGIREPTADCTGIPLNQLDLILVPGVGFDLNGRRLGRGKGYYDRLLTGIRGAKCGLAFEKQIVMTIPTEPHDITLDYIATPSRWLAISGNARI
jgi:5-formyltetrahydrofolate cyclo-ligase